MKGIKNTLLSIIVLVFAACAAVRRPVVPTAPAETAVPAVISPPEGYTAEQTASFYYFEGIRAAGIHNDLPGATANFLVALQHDSLHAPSYFELASIYSPVDPVKSLEYSKKSVVLDPGNPWFKQQLGRLYILNRDYAAARKVYDEIVRAAPDNPENYRFLAALYEETGSPYAALAVLDSAEVRFGFVEGLSSYKRQLLIQTGMTGRAIEEAQALAFNSPYDEQNFVVLGDLYAGSGQDSLALEAYHQALALQPQNVPALMSLSEFYRFRGDMTHFLSTAKRLFETDELPLADKLSFFNDVVRNEQFYREYYFAVDDLATTLAVKYPGEWEAIKLYAEHQINSGQLEEALKTYKSGLTEGSPASLYRSIVEIEAYLERSDSVARYTGLALKRFPGDLDLYFTKSIAQYHIKEYGEAIHTLEEALEYAPSDSMRSVLYSSMGEIAHRRDSLSGESVRLYRQALQYDPENLHALYNYSRSLVDAGRNPERALRHLGSDSIRSLMLGTIGDIVHQRDSVGGRRASFPYYEKALAYNPDNIHALNNYSYFLSLEGEQLEKALAMSARVLVLEPGNPTYIDTYGWILYKLGRYEEAKTSLQQAVALDREGSPELLIHYGDVLHALGDDFMASIYWKKARENGYDAREIEKRLKGIE